MKDSGVDWLGEIPSHWETSRLKSSVINVLEYATEARRQGGRVVALENVESWTGRVTQADLGSSFDSQLKRFQAGDVLFGKLRPYLAKVARSRFSGLCVGEFLVLRPRCGTYVGAYLEHLLRSKPLIEAVNSSTFGAKMPRASWQFMGGMPVARPPLSEQAAIVRFLDDADRHIRHYIRAKQKLIALLEEQKQAVIHEAVRTGQIDVRTGQPYSAYKSSGVDWLGSVPVRWEVAPLRRVTLDRCDGPFGSGLKSSHYTDQGIRVVRLQNIGHGEFRDSDATFISPEHYSSLGDHSVLSGDVLIAGLGDNNHPAGRACVAPEGIIPAMVKADCFRFRLNIEHIRPRFAALQLTATATLASAALSTGATRQRTNLKATAGRAISIPSVSEQNLIVQYIKAEVSSITGVQTAVQEKIRLLNEYRARLIADVVTGKFDVRDAAAELPEDNGRGVSEELADELAVDQEVIL